jgi:hypothetical protein
MNALPRSPHSSDTMKTQKPSPVGLIVILLTFVGLLLAAMIYLADNALVANTLAALAAILVAYLLLIASRFLTSPDSLRFERISRRIESLERNLATEAPADMLAERKRQAIMAMGPQTFYYLDQSQIQALYQQVIQDLDPKTIEVEEQSARKAGITGRFKVLEPSLERSGQTRTTKKYEVETSLATQYVKIQQALIDANQVIFGAEDFETDSEDIKSFLHLTALMKEQFNFEIPLHLQERFLHDLRRRSALEHLENLKEATGYIATQAQYVVIHAAANQSAIVLRLQHPIGPYLTELQEIKTSSTHDGKMMEIRGDSGPTPNVGFELLLAKDYLTPAGMNILSRKALPRIKITCLGRIISWDEDRVTLLINPIAIY